MVLRYGAEGMERNGLKPDEIHLVGGETESLVWRQMVADIFNQPVVSPVTTEAGALNAVLQAMWCYINATTNNSDKTSLIAICNQHVKLDKSSRCEPQPDMVLVYRKIYHRYLQLEEQLKPLNR